MSIPSWAVQGMDEVLPEIRARGEGQSCEFKEDFPAQAHELAKEVAAFATSGGGLILLGVDDDGNVIGLDEANRDKLYHRAQNIASEVQPSVNCDVALCFDEKFIIVITVRDDQSEPVFYYDYRPYIRDGRTSRPATPKEVKDKIWAHLSSEHKKRVEDLNYEIAKNAAEQSAKRIAGADEVSLKSMQDFQDLMTRSRQKFQD